MRRQRNVSDNEPQPLPAVWIDTNRYRSTAEALVSEVTQEPVNRLCMRVRGAKNMLAHSGHRSCIRDPALEFQLQRASIAGRSVCHVDRQI